ncbi:DUF3299 domain-containing protein [Caulobacter sp. RL271]|jgi:hypothetical protein|uniref:DUF3299 domain-containing protein n=1 Tax=Caulobacter segnis TaxID=88688 RepID=A0ABY4ZS45_9CAUL|nr:DUF3299 domain-containing protein [Caulobacter segnis]USQ95490.1 DUF3299 domain-containing protein [Caulobacter segnis]
MILRRGLLTGATAMAALAPLSRALAHPGGDEQDISRDPMWALLAATQLRQAPPDYAYQARYPPSVLELDGRVVEISGFITPVTMERHARQFLLTRYSIDCCPQNQPNELVEVFADQPVLQQKSEQVRLHGRFEVQDKGQVGLLFRLASATQL